jgi:hypothetical protein
MEDTPSRIGKIVHARFEGKGTKKILLLAHMDTVYLRGMGAAPTPRSRPWKPGRRSSNASDCRASARTRTTPSTSRSIQSSRAFTSSRAWSWTCRRARTGSERGQIAAEALKAAAFA